MQLPIIDIRGCAPHGLVAAYPYLVPPTRSRHKQVYGARVKRKRFKYKYCPPSGTPSPLPHPTFSQQEALARWMGDTKMSMTECARSREGNT